MTKEINTGDPVILVDAKGLEEYCLTQGMKGMANSLVNADGQDLLMFMVSDKARMYWLTESRFVLDEEALKELDNG
jgi:hypothetical protein